MSAPSCIRQAIAACRPYKVQQNITPFSCSQLTERKASFSQPRALTVARQFSPSARAAAGTRIPESDAQGFPTTPTPQPTPEHSGEEKLVASSISDPPPKRSSPTIARPSATPHEEEEKSTRVAVSTEKPVADQPSRAPRNVAAAYLTPLRRRAEYGVPSCDLQLRSYSIRNVEFMADFAMRAAYYLGLPASGPVPLPKIIERWTMPRSNFVHKKSQENFERITRRRLVQIQDGHPETVQVWLAFLRKHAFYGVGMKANVWQHEELQVGKNMDKAFTEVEKELNAKLATFGWNKSVAATQSVTEMLQKQGAKQVGVPLTDVREASQTREQRI